MLSSFRAQPHVSHLEHVKWVCSYLYKMEDAGICMTMCEPDYLELDEEEYNWAKMVDGDVSKILHKDAPKPLGKYVTLSHYIDTNLPYNSAVPHHKLHMNMLPLLLPLLLSLPELTNLGIIHACMHIPFGDSYRGWFLSTCLDPTDPWNQYHFRCLVPFSTKEYPCYTLLQNVPHMTHCTLLPMADCLPMSLLCLRSRTKETRHAGSPSTSRAFSALSLLVNIHFLHMNTSISNNNAPSSMHAVRCSLKDTQGHDDVLKSETKSIYLYYGVQSTMSGDCAPVIIKQGDS